MPEKSEIALYAPIKAFLERAGFTVKGEVRGCDVVAVRPGEEAPLVVVAELKLSLSLELLLQAADRLAVADEVWVAVAATRRGRDRDRRAVKLCRLIGLGLLAVTIRTGHVEVLAEPTAYCPRINKRRRSQVMNEFVRRRGDPISGGSTRTPMMTAYRQQALDMANTMGGDARRPRDLRSIAPDAAKILLRNVYGWFERVERGRYCVTPAGQAAIQRWQVAEQPAPSLPVQPPDKMTVAD